MAQGVREANVQIDSVQVNNYLKDVIFLYKDCRNKIAMESTIHDSFSIIQNKRIETNVQEESGFVVYIAMEEGKVSNFDLQTHDGQNVIYAANTPEQSMACLKNPKKVNMCKAIVYPNVSKTIGYMPIAQSYRDEYDIYVDNVHHPEIFLIKPERVEITILYSK